MHLSLEKKHELNVIKEIAATNSFLSMDRKDIGCQEETFDECATRKYTNELINKCKCLPLQMMILTKEVKNSLEFQII